MTPKRRLEAIEAAVLNSGRERIFVEFPDRISETTNAGPISRTREELEAAIADPSCKVTYIRVTYRPMNEIQPEDA